MEVRGIEGGAARSVRQVVFSPKGPDFAQLRDRGVFLLSPTLRPTSQSVGMGGAVAPDGKTLVTVGSLAVTVEAIDSGKELRTLPAQSGAAVIAAAYRPDGRQFATTDQKGHVQLWDAEGATPQKSFLAFGIMAMSYSADSKWLMTVADTNKNKPDEDAFERWMRVGKTRAPTDVPDNALDGFQRTVTFWDAETARPLWELSGPNYEFSRRAVLSPNGRLLATGDARNAVRIYHARSGWTLRTLEGHTGPIASLAFSPNGRLLATAAVTFGENELDLSEGGGIPKGEVKLWDVAAGREARHLPGSAFGVAFSPDGRRLATIGVRTLKLWDVATGIELLALPLNDEFHPWLAYGEKRKVLAGTGHLGLWALPLAFNTEGERLILTHRLGMRAPEQEGRVPSLSGPTSFGLFGRPTGTTVWYAPTPLDEAREDRRR